MGKKGDKGLFLQKTDSLVFDAYPILYRCIRRGSITNLSGFYPARISFFSSYSLSRLFCHPFVPSLLCNLLLPALFCAPFLATPTSATLRLLPHLCHPHVAASPSVASRTVATPTCRYFCYCKDSSAHASHCCPDLTTHALHSSVYSLR